MKLHVMVITQAFIIIKKYYLFNILAKDNIKNTIILLLNNSKLIFNQKEDLLTENKTFSNNEDNNK